MNKHDVIAAGIVAKAREVNKARIKPTPAAAAARASLMPVSTDGQAAQESKEREMAGAASAWIGKRYDAILRTLLQERVERGELPHANPEALDEAGILKGFAYPDGRAEWELNGQLLVSYWSPVVALEDGFINVQLAFKAAL